ncbi:MAG: glycoside hydrolase family 2 protein [Planctomycetota bacterium]
MMRVLDLGGNQWTVTQKGSDETLSATVPGCIHTDLMAAGVIDDPFFRDNELKLMWVGETDWVYRRSFKVTKSLFAHDRVLLQCDGLDTLAKIEINGRAVGRTDNMFRSWEFDVASHLTVGVNELRITFASPVAEGIRRDKARRLEAVGDDTKLVGSNHLRKEQCNFGWDWGPMCATSGIWRPIRLVAFNTARLDDVETRQTHATNRVDLDVRISADVVQRSSLTAVATLRLGRKVIAKETVPLRIGCGRTSMTVRDPKLWWPNGMGEQHLYTLDVQLTDADGKQLDSKQQRIGLRTIRNIRKNDRWGQSFHFEVNDQPFFAKGGNWIPADQFANRVTPQRYADLLGSCADANMNMLRVWGGGIYEDDAFYDLCDELGLMIWQDFMYACAAYPTDEPAFFENAKAEAVENVQRLRHHPCIAFYCGNNEVEMCGLVKDDIPFRMTWAMYKPFFDKMLAGVVKTHHPGIDYIPSSQFSPTGDRRNSSNPACGDAHVWNVWHLKEPFEWYRTSLHRFCSEYGFQSFPEPRTLETFTVPEDRNLTSRVMEHHQRSGIGNSLVAHYMLSWFRMPVGFENTVWLSQIQQGLAIKYAVEHWRRHMPRCMGSLYWQINDTWPGPTWSSLDYFGRWKALHYMARAFYAPLLVTGLEDLDKKTVELHVSNTSAAAATGTIQWTLTTAAGRTVLDGRSPVRAKANGNTRVTTLNLRDAADTHGPGNLLLWLQLIVGRKVISRNLVHLVRPKHIELQDPKLKAAVRRGRREGAYAVTVSAAQPALWTWLELEGLDARFSDNFLPIRPGLPITIELTPHQETTLTEVRKRLKVRSLFDTYQEYEDSRLRAE